jgi:hypothetical protein
MRNAVTLIVAISSNYKNADPSGTCLAALNAVRGKSFKELRAEHVEIIARCSVV